MITNPVIIILIVLINLVFLMPSIAQADALETEQEFYDGMGSAGWDYDDESDDEIEAPKIISKQKTNADSASEFFDVDSIPVVDEQVSRSDLVEKIKKSSTRN